MSWTDPCRNGCGGTRADCFCKEMKVWLKEVEKQKKHYKLFNGVELNEDILKELFRQNKKPIDALNDLSTVS